MFSSKAALGVAAVAILACGINIVRAQVKGVAGTPDKTAVLMKQVADLEFRVKQLERGVASINQRLNKADVSDDDDKGSKDKGDKSTESGEGKSKEETPVMTLRAPFVVVDSTGKPIFRVQDPHAKGAVSGDRGIFVYGSSGVANFALTSVFNGGKLLVESDSGARSVSVGALGTEVGMMVRADGKRKDYIGVSSNGTPIISILNAAEEFAAGLQTGANGKGLVAVFNGATPVAYLTQSSHGGGGNVTAADPGGSGVFSAGYDGSAGTACVNNKNGLHCLGIGLPLGGQ